MTAQNFKRHLQPISFAWRPLAFLPVTPSWWVQLNDLPKVVPPVDNGAKFEHRVSCLSFILSPLYHAIPLDFIDFLHKWWVIFKDITRGCYINNTACVLSHSVLSNSFCYPLDCGPPGSSVHGIFQSSILEWDAISSSLGSSWLRGQTDGSYISCISRWILYHRATWEAHKEHWRNPK